MRIMPLPNHIAYGSCCTECFDQSNAPAGHARQELLCKDACYRIGKCRTHGITHIRREHTLHAERRLRSTACMERTEHEHPRRRRRKRRLHRLTVADFADEQDIRILTQRAPHARRKG